MTTHCLCFLCIVSFGQLQRTLKGCRSEHKYLVFNEIFGNSAHVEIINKFDCNVIQSKKKINFLTPTQLKKGRKENLHFANEIKRVFSFYPQCFLKER